MISHSGRSARPRLGFVGCGQIAYAHLHGFCEASDAIVVGVTDHNLAAASEFVEWCGADAPAVHPSLDLLLEKTPPDILVISTWHADHVASVTAAAKAGVSVVLCEKPMALNLGECDEMIATCEAHGTMLAVGHQRRHYVGWTRARELVQEGAIGDVEFVTTRVRDGLLNNGTHNIDLARFLLGDPGWSLVAAMVQRESDRYERGEVAEDGAAVLAILEGGVRFWIESDLDPSSQISANATLVGTSGTLRIRESRVDVSFRHGTQHAIERVPLVAASESTKLGSRIRDMVPFFDDLSAHEFVQTFVSQARMLTDWLDGEGDGGESARDGRAAVELVMAAYESARLRAAVHAPFGVSTNPLREHLAKGVWPVRHGGAYDIRAISAAERYHSNIPPMY